MRQRCTVRFERNSSSERSAILTSGCTRIELREHRARHRQLFDRTYAEHLNLAGSADFGYPADPVPILINEPRRTAWLKLIWSVAQRQGALARTSVWDGSHWQRLLTFHKQ